MKILKTLVSILIVLLLLFFLVLPIGIGIWTKHSYTKIINSIPPSSNLSIHLVRYNLGWFQSSAILEVSLPSQNTTQTPQEIQNTRFTFYSTIQQGPIIFTNARNGSKIVLLALARSTSRSPSLNFQSTSTWNFNNQIYSLFSSSGFQLNNRGMLLKINGLNGNAHFNLHTHQWKGVISVHSGSMALQTSQDIKPTDALTFQGARYTGDMDRIGMIGYGQQTLTFNTLKLSPGKPADATTINKLSLFSHVYRIKETSNFEINLNTQQIISRDADINTLKLNFSLVGINTKALTHFLKLTESNQQFPLTKNTLSKIMETGTQLIRKGFAIKLNQFIIQTPEGKLTATGLLRIPKSENKTIHLRSLLDAKLTFQVPKSWLIKQLETIFSLREEAGNSSTNPQEIATATVKEWETKQYINSLENDYTSTITFKNGQILINGKKPDFKKTTPSDITNTPRLNNEPMQPNMDTTPK